MKAPEYANRIAGIIRQRIAEEQATIDAHEKIALVLREKFDGKKITKRIEEHVRKALGYDDSPVVSYSHEHGQMKISIWGDAYSCDLLPAEDNSPFHFTGDVRGLLNWDSRSGAANWDLMIAFPSCTDLCVSGARWFKEKRADGRQQRAVEFVKELMRAPIPRIALENPVGVLSTYYRKPDQWIQPWRHGHGETKKTHLWLKNLPPLQASNIVDGRMARVHMMSPGPNRWRERSRTLSGVAAAMAEQWGSLEPLNESR